MKSFDSLDIPKTTYVRKKVLKKTNVGNEVRKMYDLVLEAYAKK